MTTLALSRIHFPVTTLGPGRRIGIWFQGCSIRCPGCISADTWAQGRGGTHVEDVLTMAERWRDQADGITITGGEPFDQPAALLALLSGVRARMKPATDVLVFSGYPREALGEPLAVASGLVDALITDPFDAALPQTLALRGSDNQRLHLLTPLGRRLFASYERPRGPQDDRLDLMVDPDGAIWMAGIPARNDLLRLRDLLAAQGTEALVSQSPPLVPGTSTR